MYECAGSGESTGQICTIGGCKHDGLSIGSPIHAAYLRFELIRSGAEIWTWTFGRDLQWVSASLASKEPGLARSPMSGDVPLGS